LSNRPTVSINLSNDADIYPYPLFYPEKALLMPFATAAVCLSNSRPSNHNARPRFSGVSSSFGK
jgi:hypothetical protein